jgi:hypothetical protein
MQANATPLTHIAMTAHTPSLVQVLQCGRVRLVFGGFFCCFFLVPKYVLLFGEMKRSCTSNLLYYVKKIPSDLIFVHVYV